MIEGYRRLNRFCSFKYLWYLVLIESKKLYYALFYLIFRGLFQIAGGPSRIPVPARVIVVLPNSLGLGDIIMLSGVISSLQERHPVTVLATKAAFLAGQFEWVEFKDNTSLLVEARRFALMGDLIYMPVPFISAPLFALLNHRHWLVVALSHKIGIDTLARAHIRLDQSSSYPRRASALLRFSVPFVAAPTIVTRAKILARPTPLKLSATCPGRVIVLAPFAAWDSRRWSIVKWAELIDRVCREREETIVLIGSSSERHYGEDILARVRNRNRCLNLMGQTELSSLPDVFERAHCLVSVDNGPMHAGLSMNVPTVALFGCTPDRERVDGCNRVLTLNSYGSCHMAPCYSHYAAVLCPYRHQCIQDIGVEQVYEAIAKI